MVAFFHDVTSEMDYDVRKNHVERLPYQTLPQKGPKMLILIVRARLEEVDKSDQVFLSVEYDLDLALDFFHCQNQEFFL